MREATRKFMHPPYCPNIQNVSDSNVPRSMLCWGSRPSGVLYDEDRVHSTHTGCTLNQDIYGQSSIWVISQCSFYMSAECICLNCQIYLSKLSDVFVLQIGCTAYTICTNLNQDMGNQCSFHMSAKTIFLAQIQNSQRWEDSQANFGNARTLEAPVDALYLNTNMCIFYKKYLFFGIFSLIFSLCSSCLDEQMNQRNFHQRILLQFCCFTGQLFLCASISSTLLDSHRLFMGNCKL